MKSDRTKISDIDSSTKIVDFENFFDVYEDSNTVGNPYFFNLNSTVYIEGIHTNNFTLKHDMFWTTISHVLYGTTRLWWVLMKINDVRMDKTLDVVKAASTVKYIEKDEIRKILLGLRD